jgi:hypothetical protein
MSGVRGAGPESVRGKSPAHNGETLLHRRQAGRLPYNLRIDRTAGYLAGMPADNSRIDRTAGYLHDRDAARTRIAAFVTGIRRVACRPTPLRRTRVPALQFTD